MTDNVTTPIGRTRHNANLAFTILVALAAICEATKSFVSSEYLQATFWVLGGGGVLYIVGAPIVFHIWDRLNGTPPAGISKQLADVLAKFGEEVLPPDRTTFRRWSRVDSSLGIGAKIWFMGLAIGVMNNIVLQAGSLANNAVARPYSRKNFYDSKQRLRGFRKMVEAWSQILGDKLAFLDTLQRRNSAYFKTPVVAQRFRIAIECLKSAEDAFNDWGSFATDAVLQQLNGTLPPTPQPIKRSGQTILEYEAHLATELRQKVIAPFQAMEGELNCEVDACRELALRLRRLFLAEYDPTAHTTSRAKSPPSSNS